MNVSTMAMNVIHKKEKKGSKGSRSDVAAKDDDASHNPSEDEGPKKPTRHKSSAAILGQLSAQLVGKDKKEKKKKSKSLNTTEEVAVKDKRKKLTRGKSASGLLSHVMDRSDKSVSEKKKKDKKEKKSSKQHKSSLLLDDNKEKSLSSQMEEGLDYGYGDAEGGVASSNSGGLSSHFRNKNRPGRRMSTGSVVSKESTKSKVSTFWMSDNLGIKAPGAAAKASKEDNDEESVVSYHEMKGTTEAIRRATEAAKTISTFVKDSQERLQTLEEDLVTVSSEPFSVALGSIKKSSKNKGKKSASAATALDLGYSTPMMDGSEKKQSKKSKQKLDNEVGLSSHLDGSSSSSSSKRDRPRRRMSTGSVVSKESTKSKVSTFYLSDNIGIQAPGVAPKAAAPDDESVVSYHELAGTTEALKRSSEAANIVKQHQQRFQTLEKCYLGKLEEEEDIEAPVVLPKRVSKSKKSKEKKEKEIDESNNPDPERKRKVSRRMSTGGITHTMDASEKSLKKEKKEKKKKSKDSSVKDHRNTIDDGSSFSHSHKGQTTMEDGSGSSQGKKTKGSRRMTTGGLTHSMEGSDKSLPKEKKKKSKKKKKEDDESLDSSDKRKKLSRGTSSSSKIRRATTVDVPPLQPMKEKKKKSKSKDEQHDKEDKPSRRMTTPAATTEQQTNTPAKKEKKKKHKSKDKGTKGEGGGDGGGGLLATHLQRKGRPKRRNSTGSVLSKESAKSKVSTFWMTDNLGIKDPGAAATATKQNDEESVVSYHELKGTTEAIRRATEAAKTVSAFVKDNQLRLQTLEEDLVTVAADDDAISVFTTSKKTKDGKKEGLDNVWIMNDSSIFGKKGKKRATTDSDDEDDDETEDNSEAIRRSALAAEAALNVFQNQPEAIRSRKATAAGDQLGDLLETERQKVQVEIDREQDLLDKHQHRLSVEESRPEVSIFNTVRCRP